MNRKLYLSTHFKFYYKTEGFVYRNKGNVYPIVASSYLEDDHQRMTILTRQASGVASLSSGQLDVSTVIHTSETSGRVGVGCIHERATSNQQVALSTAGKVSYTFRAKKSYKDCGLSV